MAFPSVTYTFVNATTADAGQVNTNFSDIIAGLSDTTKDISVSAITAAGTITSSGTANFNGTLNAGDLKLASGKIVFGGATTPGWISNIGCTLSSGVFTITGSDGTALSASNPGYVTVPSTTGGQLITLKVTAGGTFTDDVGASDLTNLGFGITETVAWANDMPFFIYVVNRANSNIDGADGSSAFFLARNPAMATTPSSADDIGDTGAIPVNDSQTVILIMDDVTVANYTSLNCQIIGAIRMQWSTVTDDWTVQSLGGGDGFGMTQLNKTFSTVWTMPLAQNGASTGTYMLANGGTAPVFVTNNYTYTINMGGLIKCVIRLISDGGTDGAAAVDALLALPAAIVTYGYTTSYDVIFVKCSVLGSVSAMFEITNGASSSKLIIVNGSAFNNSDFGNGDRFIIGSLTYKAY